MRYGIYLTFDQKTEVFLQMLQHKLAIEIKDIPDITGKMAPHLTLLVFDDTNHESVLQKFKDIIDNIGFFSLKLNKINAFSGQQNVLYVEPLQSEALKNIYLYCRKLFANSNIVPNYRDPAHWTPHITLAKNIDDIALQKAKAVTEREWIPLEAHIQGIGLINVQNPLEVLGSKLLT